MRDAIREVLAPHQVGDPDPPARNLVRETRPNTSSRRADGRSAPHLLIELIDRPVPGHDYVGTIADDQFRGADAPLLKLADLPKQDFRVDGQPVADDARLLGIENAGGYEVQTELAPIVQDRVSGVVSGGISSDNARFAGKQVDDAAFAFVAPLPAHYYDDGHADLRDRS